MKIRSTLSASTVASGAAHSGLRRRPSMGQWLQRNPGLRPNAFTLAVASAFAMPLGTGQLVYAQALPTAPSVVQGAASFASATNRLTVTNTPGTAINWQSFNIGQGNTVQFVQQNAASMVFNKVTGSTPTSILGNLVSNGKVFLVNPNGITIGAGAYIDTAAFVASSLGIKTEDLIAGRFKFEPGTGAGKVANYGTIVTQTGGFVYFVGKNVENHGVIHTPKGEIILAAGNTVEIINPKSPQVRVEITANGNEAVNLGKLVASGGTVGMFAGNIRQAGVASASTAEVNEQGRIVFRAKQNVTLEAGSRTEASGPTAGTVTVQAETGVATVKGSIEAIGTATPKPEANLPQSGAGVAFAKENTLTVTADAAGNGASVLLGQVNIASTPKTLGTSASQADIGSTAAPTNASGAGGKVEILAPVVVLDGSAMVDASGDLGGGTILVGGDYQGKNPDVANALRTWVGQDVVLQANAELTGNGGKVIVWADEATHFVGSISARGGRQSGNGGFAEVSGKEYLFFRSRRIDLGSDTGNGGTLLLDPRDITLIRLGADASDDSTNGSFTSNTFTPSADDAQADISAIEAALNGGATVDIRTSGGGGTQSGDITVAANQTINKTGTGGATLRLNAERNIIVNSGVTIQQTTNLGASDKLNIVFNADSDADGTGYIALNGVNGNGITFTTNGGNITLGGRDTTLTGTVTGVATGDASQKIGVNLSFATLNAGTGTITAYGQGGSGTSGNVGIQITSSSLSASGISLTGTGGSTGSSSNSGIVLSGDGATLSTSGAPGLTLVGAGGGAGTLGSSNNVGIQINGSDGVTGAIVESTGAGNVVINATGGGQAGSGNNNYGLLAQSHAVLRSMLGTGGGSVTINGTGGVGTGTQGVLMQSASAARPTTVSSASGDISITGTRNAAATGSVGAVSIISATVINQSGAGALSIVGGGAAAGATSGIGVMIQAGASVTHTGGAGSGAFTISGTGVGTGVNAYGVYLDGTTTLGLNSKISTVLANLTINGTGSSTGTSNNHGVYLNGQGSGPGAIIETTGAGNVSIIGVGGGSGNSAGVLLSDKGILQSSGSGQLNITGTGTGTSAGILSTFTGNVIGSGSITGATTLVADSMDLSNVAVKANSGLLTVKALTGGRAIQLGAGASDTSSLGLTDTELANLSGTGGLVIGSIGSGTSGNITVTGSAPIANISGGAAINTSGGNIAFAQGTNVTGVNAGTNTLTLQTVGGSIDGQATPGTGIDAVATTINLSAATGIGATNTLLTTAGTIGITNATSGAIQVTNSGALTLSGVSQTGAGNVNLSTSGTLAVNGALSAAGAAVSLTTTGAVTQFLRAPVA